MDIEQEQIEKAFQAACRLENKYEMDEEDIEDFFSLHELLRVLRNKNIPD